MESAIWKIITDAGLGLGAVLALAVVVISQLKYMAKSNEQNAAVISKMSENLNQNTQATKELTEVVRGFKETDRDVIKSIEWCKAKSKL